LTRPALCSGVVALQLQFQLEFIVDRDAVIPGQRNLGFDASGFVDRSAMNGYQPQAASLVEPQGAEVVIGGD
jgi:hypothetical protein